MTAELKVARAAAVAAEMPRWVPLLALALGIGLAGGLELRSLLFEQRVGPFELQRGEPVEVHPDIAFASHGARARRVGPISLAKGSWLVVWEARNARRHDYRVEVRSQEGAVLWSKQGTCGTTRRNRTAARLALGILGLFEAPGGAPLHIDLHTDMAFQEGDNSSQRITISRPRGAPEVRLFLIPAGSRLVMSVAALLVGGVLLLFGLNDAWRASYR